MKRFGVRLKRSLLVGLLFLQSGCDFIANEQNLTEEQAKSMPNDGYAIFVFSAGNGSDTSPSESTQPGKTKVFKLHYYPSKTLKITSVQQEGAYVLHFPRLKEKRLSFIHTNVEKVEGRALLFIDTYSRRCIHINGKPLRLNFHDDYKTVGTMTAYLTGEIPCNR